MICAVDYKRLISLPINLSNVHDVLIHRRIFSAIPRFIVIFDFFNLFFKSKFNLNQWIITHYLGIHGIKFN